MQNRWVVLALVVVARTAMGFQFQSVAAVGPFLVADLGLSYAELGTLIGLYLLPGVVLALPGGLLGARFGDRAVVLAALGLMTLGGAGLAAAGSLAVAAAARLVSGAGGVLLTIQATKIVTDWFAGRELATALGLMLAAWPLGIALGLAALGTLAAATTWRTAILVPTLSAALALLLTLLSYRERPAAAPVGGRAAGRWWAITGRESALVGTAGLAWGMLNAGFILFLKLRPEAARGRAGPPRPAPTSWSAGPRSSPSSPVPLGGALLDRVRRRDALMTAGLLGAAAACGAFVLGGPAILWSALVGLLVAPAAGVVALPGEALPPSRPQCRVRPLSTRSTTSAWGWCRSSPATWSTRAAGPPPCGWPRSCGWRRCPRSGSSPRAPIAPPVASSRRVIPAQCGAGGRTVTRAATDRASAAGRGLEGSRVCGIAGVALSDPRGPSLRSISSGDMVAALHRHPGPGRVRLSPRTGRRARRPAPGHRRLGRGHQPLANEDGTVLVVCNGEIYNHVELRAELQARGHRFRTPL